MKKLLAIAIALFLLIGVSGCSSSTTETSGTNDSTLVSKDTCVKQCGDSIQLMTDSCRSTVTVTK